MEAEGRLVACTRPTLGLRVHTQTALALCEHLRHLMSVRAERYMGHWPPDAQGDDIFEEGAGRLA